MISKVLTFILILYLCYRLLRFFIRPLLVVFARRAFKKGFEKQEESRQPDGSIRIEHIPSKDKQQQTEFKGGEYVDYEEIENKRSKK